MAFVAPGFGQVRGCNRAMIKPYYLDARGIPTKRWLFGFNDASKYVESFGSCITQFLVLPLSLRLCFGLLRVTS